MHKKMILLLMILLFVNGADASVFKGQRSFMKLCKKCHSNSLKFIKSHTQNEWQLFFDKDAQFIFETHKKDKKAMEILNSKYFKKNLKHLRQFLKEYASDSGNVPACN